MKTRFFAVLILIIINVLPIKAQVQLRNDNTFMVGYNVYTPLTLGYFTSNGINNGTWSLESFDDGFNIWKPWPSVNFGNYKLFIKDDNGYVGIGKKPSYKLDVDGDIATYGTLRISSDVRLKSNINALSNCLSKISKLNGKSYSKALPKKSYNRDNIKDSVKYKTMLYESQKTEKKDNSVQLGLLANEVKLVFPELVTEDVDGYMSVDYIGLIPVIIEALKEQKVVIESQAARIKALENGSIRKINSNQGTDEIVNSSNYPTLDQNAPNPFNQSTSIGYYIPETSKNAVLYIYNMNGMQLKSIPIQTKGKGNIIIIGSEFLPGMYIYTLTVDSKEIDTKRMILTE